MPFYYTDHNKFYNPFAMFAYAAYNTPHTYPIFDFFTAEFDKLDWTNEPAIPWQVLLDMRVKQLRQKYSKLGLLFSGGTDSATIYRAFERNNIHLDEIILTYTKDPNHGHPASMADWLLENCYDKTTKITIESRDQRSAAFSRYNFTDSTLVDNNLRHSTSMRNGLVSDVIAREDTDYSDPGSAIIIGLEKPHIRLVNGRWETAVLDKIFYGVLNMTRPNIEYFFITPDLPELHIKQCHMMMNMAQMHLRPTGEWYSSKFGDRGVQEQVLLAEWCGLEKSMKPEMLNQKFWERANLKVNAIKLVDKSAPLDHGRFYSLEDQIDSHYTKKLLSAFAALQSDAKIIDYMKRLNLLPANGCVDQHHGNYSKWRVLGTQWK